VNKKRTIKIVLSILLAGFAAWAIIPLFIDTEVSELAPESATIITASPSAANEPDDTIEQVEESAETAIKPEERERTSRLQGRNSYDAVGTVKLIEDADGTRFVRFEDNFKTDNGPDLIVYIGNSDDRGLSLGALKGNIGAQNYELPDDLDLTTVDTVRIFCRAFNLDFAIATL